MENTSLNRVIRSRATLKNSNLDDDNRVKATGIELLDLVWQLSAEIYSLRGIDVESRLQRNITNLIRQRS